MVLYGLTAWAVDHESTVEKMVTVKPHLLPGSGSLNSSKQVCRAASRPMKLSFASHTALMPDKEHALELPDYTGYMRGVRKTEYPDLQEVFRF